jgi:hypothetical protein
MVGSLNRELSDFSIAGGCETIIAIYQNYLTKYMELGISMNRSPFSS